MADCVHYRHGINPTYNDGYTWVCARCGKFGGADAGAANQGNTSLVPEERRFESGSAAKSSPTGQVVKHGGNMTTHKRITNLWMAFQNAIDAADVEGRRLNSADGHAQCNALHDYTRERGWRMATLLGREAAAERQHRRTTTAPESFSVSDAAKLQIMQWAEYAALNNTMPPAHHFLTMRPTAVEAEVIGFLTRRFLNDSWRAELAQLDYASLMQST